MENITATKPDIRRKFIPMLATLGSLVGLFLSGYHISAPQADLISLIAVFAGCFMIGTFLSFLLLRFPGNRKSLLPRRDFKGEAYTFRQPVYLLSIPMYMFAFLFSPDAAGLGFQLIFALANGTAFLLGLANGIFDYRNTVTQKLLYAGVVPIGLSFIYSFYFANDAMMTNLVWIFGSLYLMAYMLLVNRIQLNSILFFQRSVNVENSRRIRIQNDILIAGFYLVYLVIYFFREIFQFSYVALLAVFHFIFDIMSRIMEFLLVEVGGEQIPPLVDVVEPVEQVPMSPWITYMLYILLGTAALVALIFLIIFSVRIIRRVIKAIVASSDLAKRATKERKVFTLEYEEETEIVKMDKMEVPEQKKRKCQFTLKDLAQIRNNQERIRYVYGYVLERLRIREMAAPSDAPDEILDKLTGFAGWERLQRDGFPELTEEYSRVRYGGKETVSTVGVDQVKSWEKHIELISRKSVT